MLLNGSVFEQKLLMLSRENLPTAICVFESINLPPDSRVSFSLTVAHERAGVSNDSSQNEL